LNLLDEKHSFLKHWRFSSQIKRMGLVVRAHHEGIQFWQRNRAGVQQAAWIGSK
jgi:magnesium-transporting ATPase (P-type)